MADRMTKLLLGAIAIGLWANLTVEVLRPTGASAQANPSLQILNLLSGIYNGTCVNRKICG
jgi:hypothetical protein